MLWTRNSYFLCLSCSFTPPAVSVSLWTSSNWMLTPWASPTPCISGMEGTCCRLILLPRSELRSGSHSLGQTCPPEYQYPQKKRQGSDLIQKTHGKPQLTAGKRGWESCTDASQQGSTAEPRHCWAGSINRTKIHCPEKSKKGWKNERPGGSTPTENGQ